MWTAIPPHADLILKLKRAEDVGQTGIKAYLYGDGSLRAAVAFMRMARAFEMTLPGEETRQANRLLHELPGSTGGKGVLLEYRVSNEGIPVERVISHNRVDPLLDALHLFYLEGLFCLEAGRAARAGGELEICRAIYELGIEQFDHTKRPEHLPPSPDYEAWWRREATDEERLISIGAVLESRIKMYEQQVGVKAVPLEAPDPKL